MTSLSFKNQKFKVDYFRGKVSKNYLTKKASFLSYYLVLKKKGVTRALHALVAWVYGFCWTQKGKKVG